MTCPPLPGPGTPGEHPRSDQSWTPAEGNPGSAHPSSRVGWEAGLGILLSPWQRVSYFHRGAGKTVSLCSSNTFCSWCFLLVFTVQLGW